VIKRHFSDPEDRFHYKVEFVNLKEQIYGKNGKTKKGEDDSIPAALAGLMSDQELRKLYSRIEQITGRVFEGKEPAAILEWLGDYGIDKELVVYAYEYCETKRKNTKYNYVAAVVKEWAGKGFKTVAQIEDHLAENDNRHYLYKRIMKSLGFLRNATE
jgi:DnaD/phage-associated family protein